MSISKGHAHWEGTLKEGQGAMILGDNGRSLPYDFSGRFEDGESTNPEELIGSALAGCYSMALAHELTEAGHPPERIDTTSQVFLEKSSDGFMIPKIEMTTEVESSGLDESQFEHIAKEVAKSCPVAKVLATAEISLKAKLLSVK